MKKIKLWAMLPIALLGGGIISSVVIPLTSCSSEPTPVYTYSIDSNITDDNTVNWVAKQYKDGVINDVQDGIKTLTQTITSWPVTFADGQSNTFTVTWTYHNYVTLYTNEGGDISELNLVQYDLTQYDHAYYEYFQNEAATELSLEFILCPNASSNDGDEIFGCYGSPYQDYYWTLADINVAKLQYVGFEVIINELPPQ